MGHEYGVCLEGPKGKVERKSGEDEHKRRTLNQHILKKCI